MKPTITRRFFVFSLLLLCLPVLTCLIFQLFALQYAKDEAFQSLQEIQDQISTFLDESFSLETDDPVATFLHKAGPYISRTPTKASMIIFAREFSVIYPRDETARSDIMPLAEDFAAAIRNASLQSGSFFTASDGIRYLVNVNAPPQQSERLRYVITYCPSSESGAWVQTASVYVLIISSVMSLLAFWALRRTAGSIVSPLRKLCLETQRIGSGDFRHIESEFSLQEPEMLRVAMNCMADQLQRATELQQQFLQDISHELRTPLTAITGYAQGIQNGVFQDPANAATSILAGSQRLTDVVSKMLTLSRLESSMETETLVPIPLGETIQGCFDHCYSLAEQRGIVPSVDRRIFTIDVLGKEDLLENIFDNLIANAIRYARKVITLSVQTHESFVLVSLSDDGDGITEKDLPHIFDRFYKGEGGQFGLGLAIAKNAAERMDGSLTASNSPEGGAVFTVRLHLHR